MDLARLLGQNPFLERINMQRISWKLAITKKLNMNIWMADENEVKFCLHGNQQELCNWYE